MGTLGFNIGVSPKEWSFALELSDSYSASVVLVYQFAILVLVVGDGIIAAVRGWSFDSLGLHATTLDHRSL
jgi:hypothetical protein